MTETRKPRVTCSPVAAQWQREDSSLNLSIQTAVLFAHTVVSVRVDLGVSDSRAMWASYFNKQAPPIRIQELTFNG